MAKRSYHKLVRDNIPTIIQASGAKPVTRILEDKEYLRALIAKLREEVVEFEAEYSFEELADISEVVIAIREALGIEADELEKLRHKKATKNGRFKERIFLEGVE